MFPVSTSTAAAAAGYRAELDRLRASPVRQPTETTLLDPPLRLMDGPSFVPQYEEIWLYEIYDFPFARPGVPVIVDGGANVGAAVIWWRARWPGARVVAFEADPAVYEVMAHNLRHEAFQGGLDLRCGALSTSRLGAVFMPEGTDAGRLLRRGEQPGPGQVSVPTESLAAVLGELGHVDLLKLDVEGAETELLVDARAELDLVDRVFVEYHSFASARQELAQLLGLLDVKGFRVHVATPPHPPRPFRGVPVDRCIDLTCNIWAWREG